MFSEGIKCEHCPEMGLKLALGSVESRIVLTFFFLMFPFDSPQNIRKPNVCRCFQGGIKREHYEEKG